MKGIKYISCVGTSGYAEAARRYILGLARAGIPITWAPIIARKPGGAEVEIFTGTHSGDAVLDPFCNRAIDYDTVIIHAIPWIMPFLAQREPGKKIFGYSAWETDRLPGGWAEILNSLDAIIVPCAWNRAVFQAGGVQAPIHVVPHLFCARPVEKTGALGAASPRAFVFYTINTWIARKGIAELLEVYLQTFTAQDNVVLVIKTEPRGIRNASLPWLYLNRFLDQIKPLLRRFFRHMRRPAYLVCPRKFDPHCWLSSLQAGHPNPPRIELVTAELSTAEISNLHQRGDCFVSLTKGEGWGLGAFDAAGHGNGVIMTGFGGQLDYLDNENAYLVNYRLTPVRNDLYWANYTPDQNWAEADKQHAAQLMRHVYLHQEEARAKAIRLQSRILRDFGEQAVISRFLEALTSPAPANYSAQASAPQDIGQPAKHEEICRETTTPANFKDGPGMTKDIVVMPVFNRPEYIYVCLNLLKNVAKAGDLHYLFAADYGYDKKNCRVIHAAMRSLDATYEIRETPDKKYKLMKQSYNVLSNYLYAAEKARRFVFLVEDDIFCGQDFFKFHYTAHEQHADLFCSIASRLHNPVSAQYRQSDKVTTYKLTPESVYQSWGVCFRKAVIQEMIRPHALQELYYRNPRSYLLNNFKNSHISNHFCEQDGLIRRIHKTSGMLIAYPDYPRCYHAGLWGYHRTVPKMRWKSFETKVKFIMDNCFDNEKLRQYNQYADSETCDLSVNTEISPQLAACRTLA